MKKILSILIFAVSFWLVQNRPALAANSGTFTMSLWVNPSTSVASKALIAKAEEFRVFTNASGYPGCQIKTTSWQTAAQSSTKALTLSSWNHVVCTYDLVNLKVYVNGLLTSQTSLTSLPDDTANVLRIGQDDSSGTSYGNLAGTVDEFRFYNYSLSSDEVATDYNAGSALVLGSLGNLSTLSSNAAGQQYCIPGSSDSCAAPVAEWNFEEGSGSTVNDTSGNGNTGTFYGSGSHWGPGKIGKAGVFNGGNDYVSTAYNATLNITSDLTISAWVKPITLGEGDIGYIVSNRPGSGSGGYAFSTDSSNRLGFRASTSGYYSNTNSVTLNRWQFVSVTRSGTNLTFYVNGIASGTATVSTISSSADGVNLGQRDDAVRHFNGSIDQVRIFNYARSAAQIAWDYNRGGPVARYKMDECTGTSIKDSSGNGLHGTLTNANPGTCSDGTNTTNWSKGSNGKFNSSMYFDGTDDYVNLGNSSTLNPTSQITVSAWIRSSAFAGEDTIISKSYNDGSWNSPWVVYLLRLDTTGTVLDWGTTSSGGSFDSQTYNYTFSPNTWYHLVAVSDGTNKKVYINGVLVKTSAWANSLISRTSTAYIAKDDAGGNTDAFPGQIDDVQIFNYALTSVQVKNLYNQNSAIRFGP